MDGSIAVCGLFINPGGTLGGHGFIAAAFSTMANVAPGDSPGTLTIKGNYTQSPGGTLTIQIAGKNAGQYDVLAVQGQAKLDGTLRLVEVGNKAPRLKVGQHIDIVTAGQGVTGTFDKCVQSF
ncbi:MAG: autotransporter outer membrane beta-barrel domain-containing protein [Chthoniobacter sp.]